MYNTPSRKRKKIKVPAPNLIPILDAVFIFIFFLLVSANYIKIFEIKSDIPIISNREQEKSKEKPLALSLKILSTKIEIHSGIPSKLVQIIDRNGSSYNLNIVHDFLVKMKKKHKDERTIILEPMVNLTYEKIIEIMDTVRLLNKTDPAFYKKDKDGFDIKVEELFDNIIFGNIQS